MRDARPKKETSGGPMVIARVVGLGHKHPVLSSSCCYFFSTFRISSECRIDPLMHDRVHGVLTSFSLYPLLPLTILLRVD